MADRLLELFPEVARVAADLIRHPEVARRWDDESACAGMTVGGLANHLAGQAANVVLLLSAPPHDADPIPALEHYRRAAWVHTGLDDEANVDVRTSADAYAASGAVDLETRVQSDLDALPAALAPVLDGSRTPDSVLIPWQGWSLIGRRLRADPHHGGDRALRRPRREHRCRHPGLPPTRRRMPCSACSRRSPPSGTARPRCCGRSAAPSGRPARSRPSDAPQSLAAEQSGHRPSISTVCRTWVKPCAAATASAQRSTASPVTSTASPHERHTTWWWWSVEHER